MASRAGERIEGGYESGVAAARRSMRSKAICDWLNEPGWSDWKQGVNAAVNEIERALHHDIPAPSPPPPGGAEAGAPVACDRESLGRRVRQVWIAWAKRQPIPKPSWLVPYAELSEADKEADRCIGAALWGDGFACGIDAHPSPPAPLGDVTAKALSAAHRQEADTRKTRAAVEKIVADLPCYLGHTADQAHLCHACKAKDALRSMPATPTPAPRVAEPERVVVDAKARSYDGVLSALKSEHNRSMPFGQVMSNLGLDSIESAERVYFTAKPRLASPDAPDAALPGDAETWWRLCVERSEWLRDEGVTRLAVRVHDGADLSCQAMRQNAMQRAIAAARKEPA